MNGLALCAGIGGLELGIAAALPDYRTVAYVEREAYAACVLAARMEAGDIPPAPIYSDLRTFDGRPWHGVVDLVSAGYPCQPFSVAGSRSGTDDPRHLWPEVYRIIREVRPRLVFLENVPGHLSMGFGDVLGDLAAAGFNAEWGVFSAAEIGAPHLRKRLFCLAFTDAERERRGRGAGSSSGDNATRKATRREKSADRTKHSGSALADADRESARGLPSGEEEENPRTRVSGQHVADSDRGRLQREREQESSGEQSARRGQLDGRSQIREQQHAAKVPDSRRRGGEGEGGEFGAEEEPARRLSQSGVGRALPYGVSPWLDEPKDLSRVTTGTAYRADRLRALGNAVVPAQAAYAFRQLAERIA